MYKNDQQSESNNGGNTFLDVEVSIKEILAIIVKRKWIIICIFSLSLLTSIFYLLSKQLLYESYATFQMGKVYETKLEDPSVLTSKLMEMYGNIKLTKKWAALKSVSYDSTTNTFTLISKGNSPLETQKCLKKILAYVIKRHDLLFKKNLGIQQKNLVLLQKQCDLIESELNLFEKQRINYFRQDNALGIMFAMEEMKLIELKPKVEQNMEDLKSKLSDLYTKPTQIIQQPTYSNKPTDPKYTIYFVMGGFLGLIIGILSALVIEFYGCYLLSWKKNSEV